MGSYMTRMAKKGVKLVIHIKYKIPCQNEYKTDPTVIQQHQKPNKSHNDPDLTKKNTKFAENSSFIHTGTILNKM